MKNETLLNNLQEILYLCDDREKQANKMHILIEKVKREILLEENKGKTSKQRINFCLNWLNKISLSKPSLKYCDKKQFEGFQAITDSYIMVLLSEEDQIPVEEAPTEINYPRLTTILDKRVYNNNLITTFKCNVGKTLQFLKAHKKALFINQKTNFKALFCYENFRNFVTFLNLNPSDNIVLYGQENYCEKRPCYVEKQNGSSGIILPLYYNADTEYKVLTEEDSL